MDRAPEEPLHPLAPGTRIGAWRVEIWRGQGAHGAVYRAVRVGQEHAGPVALKVSLLPGNKRLVREAELLSRLSHPSIPRLLDRGMVLGASGAQYPFCVMEWVEGTRLYAWAEQRPPSSAELCLLLAGLARALESLHISGGVHRDVKGDNVLVRLSDRLPVLIDFGSGHYQEAERLTWQSLAPFTPGYLSAQACLFLRSGQHLDSYYAPTPADDLYALGVTAYRLVMGEYPPPMKMQQDKEGCWHVSSPDPKPLLENNPRVEPALRELIIRLLSDEPATRGTAAQTAEELEAAAAERSPAPDDPAPARGAERPERVRPPARARVWKPWPALAVAGVCAVLLWSWQRVPRPPVLMSASTQQASETQAPDAGTAALGDSSTTAPQDSTPPATDKRPIAQSSPPEPRPGQVRPNEKGRCPGPQQVPINGGCWFEFTLLHAEECTKSGNLLLNGKCYVPVFVPPQKTPPTSSPAEAR
jgi:serine/threonine protein kinase